MITIRTAAGEKERPALYIDLSVFSIIGLGLFIIITPLMRGLFFEEEFVPAQMFLGVIWLVFGLDRLLKKDTTLKLTIQDLFAAGFVLAYIISLLNAVHIKEAVFGAFRALDYVLIYFMASYYSQKEQARTKLVSLIFLSTVIVAAIGLLSAAQTVNYPGAYGAKRIMSVFQYGNAFGIYTALGFFLGLALLFSSTRSLTKALIAVCIYLNLAGMLGSQSRGAWLIFGLGLLGYLLGTRKEDFWNTFYSLFSLLLPGLIGSKGFLQGVYSQNYLSAYKWLALGAILVAAAAVLIHNIPAVINKRSTLARYKAVINWALALNLLFCVIVYFAYTSSVLPNPTGQLFTTEVLARAGQISGEDPSFQGRVELNRWALRIIREHPFLGVGAGGWNALYHLYQDKIYWSSEVHNHFLQTWIEAGLAGIVFYLAFWFWLIFRLGKMLPEREANGRWPFAWSAMIGLAVLFIHSGIDFELSLPAIAMVFWTLGAVLKNEAGGAGGSAGGSKCGKTVRVAAPVHIAALLLVGLVLIYPAYREYRAGLLSAEGSRAMLDRQYQLALDKMEQAYRLSPLSASIAADLAQLRALRYRALAEEADKEKAYYFAARAVELAPFNIRNGEAVIRAYLLLGDKEAALGDSERIAAIIPKDVLAQENLAKNYLASGLNYLEREETVLAGIYLERVVRVAEKVDASYQASNKAYNMKPSPQLELAAGQAHLLLQNRAQALEKLNLALKNSKTKTTAGLWLAAAYSGYDQAKHQEFYKQYVASDSRCVTAYGTICKWLKYSL